MDTEIVVNSDPHAVPSDPLSRSSEVTDVANIPKANGVFTALIKPQISIEQADDDEIAISPPTTPPSAEVNVSMTGVNNNEGVGLRVNPCTHVYPKTPPANYKFTTPSTKFKEGTPLLSGSIDDESDDDSCSEERAKQNEGGKDCLQVRLNNSRSHSLPLGIKMEVKDLNRISSNSDETAESEESLPSEKHKRMRPHDHLERLDSAGSDISPPDSSDDFSSDGGGDEEKLFKGGDVIPPPGLDQEDDIFIDGELSDMQEQADTKLINWAYNDFVPACHQLLSECSGSVKSTQIKSTNIQADLRSLSNSITFFCSEHQQRLNQVLQLRPIILKGNNQSTNSLTFSHPVKNFIAGDAEVVGSDRSYAVKVLRSASQSLIAPLLIEASEREEFTPDLHQAIIKALQKIAWKVEACISFGDPSLPVKIHTKIFDAQHIKNIRELMIQALPPAEPNLRTVPLSTRRRKSSVPALATEFTHVVPMRRGQSVKERMGGELVDTHTPPTDLHCIGETGADDSVWKEGSEVEGEGSATASEAHQMSRDAEEEVREGEKQSPVEKEVSREGTPNLPRRERIATEGEADLRNKVPLSRNFGSIPNLDKDEGSSEGLDQSGISSTVYRGRYFRPRAFRRTTISLSKKEVRTLGLTVAKRVDESILDDIRLQCAQDAAQKRLSNRGSKSEEKAATPTADHKVPGQRLELQAKTAKPDAPSDYGIESSRDLDEVGNRLHCKLTKEFDHIRSVSMSDLIDSDSASLPDVCSTPDPSTSDREIEVFSPLQPNQRLELVPSDNSREINQHLHVDSNSRVASPSSQPVSPNYEKCYTPVRRSTHIPSSSSSDWVTVEAEKRKKSVKGRAKATIKKSISTSGKFAHSLLKTARSLRHGSVVRLQQQKMSKSLSAADLLDESGPQQQSNRCVSDLSRLSVSVAPSPVPYDTATLPIRSNRMNTIARIIRGRSKDPRSHSFGKSDRHVPAGLSSWQQSDFTSFTDSMETVSRNAIHSMALESEEQLLISVDMATKLQRQAIRNRSSTIRKESSSNPWFQISVSTNIKRFGRQDYIILRPFKEIQKLIDSLSSSHGAIDLPRPDKKSKKQMKGMEDLLRSIAGNDHLRSNPAFVTFLMPDDQFGSFTENDHSEVSFERLMTFYTPDLSSAPAGSFPSVQVVAAEHVPASPSPDAPHRSSLKGGHKKGSMHYMKKKDGKEDTSTFVIQEEGEDALIVACEDDHYVVVAGTFEKLVEQLACEEKPDARFVSTFLLGYRHFATTLEFLTKLLDRFHITLPPNPTEEEMAYAEKWSYVIQLRVLDILTYWMKKCWPDIYRNPPVLEKLREFATSLKATDDHNFQYAGTNIEKIITEKMANSAQYCLPLNTSSRAAFTSSLSPTSTAREHHISSPRATGSHSHHERVKRSMVVGPRLTPNMPGSPHQAVPNKKRISSSGSYGAVDICSLPAIQLARQLTLIELEFLRAIDVHELVVYTWDPNTPENKPYRRNLDAFIERFNKVSYWVASEICCVEDARLRGILIEKFIEVAKHCHEYKNYNTTISVLSGLSLAAVRRLKRSWELVNEKTRKWFAKLQPLTSPSTNHCNYRRTLATVTRRDPCIPYLGVFMRDLTFFNDGNTKRLKNGLYNFSKLRTMVHKFEELKRYQRSKYPFPTEDKIREFCRNLWCLSESELYDASLHTEPREETDI